MSHEVHSTRATGPEGTKGAIPLNHIEGGNNHFPLEVRGGNPFSTGAQGDRTNPPIPHAVEGSRAQTDRPVIPEQSERLQREVTTSPNRHEYEQSGQRELTIPENSLLKSASDPTRAGELHESITELLVRPYRMLETPLQHDRTPESSTPQWSQQPQIHHQGRDGERRGDENDASRQPADKASRPDGGIAKWEREAPERAVEQRASERSEQEARETLAMVREIVGGLRAKEFMQILQSSEQGQEALDSQRRYNVDVIMGPKGGGSSYKHNGGFFPITIIELSTSLESMATLYVHEMSHAEDYHTGRIPDIHTSSREVYVQAQLRGETRAQIKAIQHNIQRGGVEIPLQSVYEKAYQKGSEAEQERNPHATSDERDRAGQATGWQAVYERMGRMRASTTGELITDFYEGIWNKAHGITS